MWLVYVSLLSLALVAHVVLCAVVSRVAPPPSQVVAKDPEDEVSETATLLQAQQMPEQSNNPAHADVLNGVDKLSDDGWEPLDVVESQV